MRTLSLDVGTKRIGVAISDSLGITAQPVKTIDRIGIRRDVEAIVAVLDEYECTVVVVGLPLSLRGHENPSTAEARLVSERLEKKRPDLVIHFVDERFSTAEAERSLIESNVSRKKRRKVVDQTAAVLILRTWLDTTPTP